MAKATGRRLLKLATAEVSTEADVEQFWVPAFLVLWLGRLATGTLPY